MKKSPKLEDKRCNVLTVLIMTLFAMAPVVVPNTTVAKPAEGSLKQYDAAKIQPSTNRPLSSISKAWGSSSRQGSGHPSQDGLSLVSKSCPVTPSKSTTD